MSEIIDQQGSYTKEISREFFKNVYSYMFGALAISGILASYCGNEAFFNKYFISQDRISISPLFWVVALAPLGLGLIIQTAYQRLSYGLLLGLFVLYSALMGVSLSVIFLVYALPTLASTFFVTAGAFAGMAILGYTTKQILPKWEVCCTWFLLVFSLLES